MPDAPQPCFHTIDGRMSWPRANRGALTSRSSAREGPSSVILLDMSEALHDDHSPASLPRQEIEQALDLWCPGATKSALVDFLDGVVNGPEPVPVAERVAAFDNDGTVAVEKPKMSVLTFLEDSIDQAGRTGGGRLAQVRGRLPKPLALLLADPLLPKGVDAHAQRVDEFLGRYRHPRFERRWGELAYAPMLQLLHLLHRLDFEVYLVSGSSRDFLRGLAPAYDMRRSRVIGTETAIHHHRGQLRRGALPHFPDIGEEKVENLWEHSGHHALLAMGNTTQDVDLLKSARFAAIVCHDDGEREYAYTDERVERLARERGWLRVSMKDDFAQVFAPQA